MFETQAWERALAYAWFYLINQDTSMANSMSQRGVGHFDKLAQQLLDEKIDSASQLHAELKATPLGLVRALDQLTSSNIFGRPKKSWANISKISLAVSSNDTRLIFVLADVFEMRQIQTSAQDS